jgi:hypothetical protein
MQSIFQQATVVLSLAAIAGLFSVQAGMAQPYYYERFEQPVLLPEPPVYDNYPPPVFGPGYVVRNRPFSLHRFVGNAVGGAVGASKHVVFGGPGYYWY